MALFALEELDDIVIHDRPDKICRLCGLYKGCLSPKMDPYGSFRRKIMVVGEAPGPTEDKRGKPWQGKVGRFLRETMEDLGLDLFTDCVCVNAVACFPKDSKGDIRGPENNEIDSCWTVKVKKAIDKYKPNVIILLGGAAVQSVLGKRWGGKQLGGVSRWRGTAIPDQDLGAWICTTFHPSYVLRNGSEFIENLWLKDLRRYIKIAKRDLFPERLDPEIVFVNSKNIGDAVYDHCRGAKLVAFDYETTGIKPDAEGHRIVCGAFCADGEKVVTGFFPLDPNSVHLKGVKAILRDKKIGKTSHNIKFEQTWSKVWLGVAVRDFVWDSMVVSHILDPRPLWNSLAFQTYINFGEVGYDKIMSPVLDASHNKSKHGSNGFNKLVKFVERSKGDRKKVLTYCGLDSYYQFNLALRQMKKVDKDIYLEMINEEG